MPTVEWGNPKALNRARAQVKRAEPLILTMPESASLAVDADAAGCQAEAEGLLANCRPDRSLYELAGHYGLEGLEKLAAVARNSGVAVDIDTPGHRVVIHD
jgi:hypothetical protein